MFGLGAGKLRPKDEAEGEEDRCVMWPSFKSAPRLTGRRSHWTERGDDNIFLRLAIVVRLCHGTLLCELSIPKCGGVLGGNDQNRAEKQNVVLTW